MNKVIQCFVPLTEIAAWKYGQFMAPMFIMSALRKAGIPVKGLLFFQGIESGTLYEMTTTRGFEYEWHP